MPEVNSNGMILAKDEENDAEVRREDQDKINEFGLLNARLHEVRAESKRLKVSGFVLGAAGICCLFNDLTCIIYYFNLLCSTDFLLSLCNIP
jgi:hypothetical protein